MICAVAMIITLLWKMLSKCPHAASGVSDAHDDEGLLGIFLQDLLLVCEDLLSCRPPVVDLEIDHGRPH